MRLTSLFTLFLFACAPESGSPELTESPLASGPTVNLEFPYDGTTIAIRAVRVDSAGEIVYLGNPIAKGVVADGAVSLTLPLRPPQRDKTSDTTAPVNYVAFAFTDFATTPDEYAGISAERITFFSGKVGTKKGWYVQSVDETGTPSWASTDKVVSIPPTLVTNYSSGLSGVRGEGFEEGTLAVGFEFDGTFVETTSPLEEEFHTVISGAPDETVELADGTSKAILFPRVFLDADADGAYGGEDKVVGQICVGARSVYLEWTEGPHTPEQALAFHANRTAVGWSVWAADEEERVRIGDFTLLRAETACHEPVVDDGNVDEGDGSNDTGEATP